MLNSFLNHIKGHKLWYSFGMIVLLFCIVIFSYYQAPNPNSVAGELSGQVAMLSKAKAITKAVPSRPKAVPVADSCQNQCSFSESCIKLECGTDEWACSPKVGGMDGDAECKKRGYGVDIQQGDETRAMLAKAVVIELNAELYNPAVATFTDVANDAWYYQYIETAVKLGFMSGQGNNKFGPSELVSNVEVIKTIVTALNIAPATGNLVLPFTDVSVNDWYYNSVAAAYQAQLITDSGNHLFHPSDQATKSWVDGVLANAN